MPLLSRRFVIGFVLGLLGTTLVVGAVAFGLSRLYDGKIMPGVRVGTVDLSGLTRDEAIGRLDSAYAYLRQGKIVLTTPGGTGTITYQEAGRGPDSAAMADAALAEGRADDPLTSVAATIRTVVVGADVPVMVKLDPKALAASLQRVTSASLVPPRDASVVISGTGHTVLPAAAGHGVDETAIAARVIDQLSAPGAPAEREIGGSSTTVEPRVSDADAAAAAKGADNMAVVVTLTNGDKTWTIDAATIHSWITFGVRAGGTYASAVDPASVKTFVASLAKDVDADPVEPKVIYKDGLPNGLSASTPGKALNVDATAQAVESYLDGLGSGNSNPVANLAVVVDDVAVKLVANPGLAGFVRVGQWSTTYFPGESNGNGRNIEIPAEMLNGTVIGPGQQFSFLNAVPIDEAHGFRPGGVILDGKSNHTGAIGGGICSASTTFFNAAARAGLQIDERHAHFYYVNRYPVGLDATVYSNGTQTLDMRWTNDTDNPIVIRSWWTGRSTRVITVELWSLPIGRTTTFSGGVKSNVVKATDGTQYVPSLPAGQKTYRAEYPTDGYNTVVTRTVVDKSGTVIHLDTWTSRYTKVDGLLQIAGTPPPSPSPTAKLTPTPGQSSSPSPGPTAPRPSPTPPSPSPSPSPSPGQPAPSPSALPPAPNPTPIPPSPRRRRSKRRTLTQSSASAQMPLSRQAHARRHG
jgi:vancomycin resistance protein YoaR